MPPEDKRAEQLKRAREALGGGRVIRDIRPPQAEKITPPNLSPEELEKRRALARTSLEGYDRRKRREEKEHQVAAKIEAQKKLMLDMEAKRRATAEAALAKKRAEEESLKAAEEAKKRRLAQVAHSEEMIDKLKKDPTISLKAVRTYQTDLASGLRNSSTINEIAKESRSIMENLRVMDPERQKKKKLILAIVALLVVAGGVSGLTWYLSFRGPAQVELPTTPVTALIPAETNSEVYLTDQNSYTLRELIRQKRERARSTFAIARAGGGPIENIYFTEALARDPKTGQPTSKTVVGLTRYLSSFNLALPFDFKLAVTDNFMLGLYQAPKPALFYVFKISSYEQAGRALKDNGSQIADSLFSPLIEQAEWSRSLRDLTFKSEIIDNTNVEVLRTAEGEAIMLYSFLDEKTLVLAESVEAFQKLLGLYQLPLPVSR